MRYIHRADMNGNPLCGFKGFARISTTGVMLTCPECIRLSKSNVTHYESMKQLLEAAERFRQNHTDFGL